LQGGWRTLRHGPVKGWAVRTSTGDFVGGAPYGSAIARELARGPHAFLETPPMTTSAESARQPSHEKSADDKIEFACSCGKKYRDPASRAGKQVRCRSCRVKVRVPGRETSISLRTRKAILGELGIDPDQAEQEFEEEQKKSYVCSLCASTIAEEELSGAYSADGIVCTTCRAAAVEQRGDDPDKKKKAKRIEKWSREGSVEGAKKKAWAYGALFFLGTAGFVHSIFAAPVIVTLGVATVLASVGGRAIFKAYEPVPETPKKK
jgi:hypothetical protein